MAGGGPRERRGGDDRPRSAIDEALHDLDRQRRDRYVVGAVLVLGVVAALSVGMLEGSPVTDEPWAIGAFLGVSALYWVSVAIQERRARRTVRGLVAEREQRAALEARVQALETLHEVGRDIAAAEDDLPGVFERVLAGALQLTSSPAGAVLLRVGDTLTVAASDGPDAPEPGTRFEEDDGPAWEAVRSGSARVVARGEEWGMVRGSATLAAPLHLPDPDRIVGALVVERRADDPGFAAADRLAAALLAQQAALAVRNASRLDRAREGSQQLTEERERTGDALRALTEQARGRLAAVTGTVQLLQHRGDGFPAARRQALLEDLLEEASALRELLGRVEELT
jgi:K+-sensing histidine kinase KdpD